MTVPPRRHPHPDAPIRDVDDLVRLLGVPYNPEQLAAIVAPLQPGVIVAGAGSGKTTVMAARVVWLVGTGQVPADAVLGLTFTTKAAGELNQRIRAALTTAGIGVPTASTVTFNDAAAGEDPGEPTVSTYHSFAAQLIEEHGLRLGVEPHARLLADASRYQLAARVICRARGPFPALEKSVPDLVVDLLSLEGEISEHLVDIEELRAHDRDLLGRLDGVKGCETPSNAVAKAIVAARRRLEFADLVEAYRAEKADRDLVDFGDQMAIAARLAEQCPPVGATVRERFRVVLLDEYQDTSVAQRRMLVGLFGGGHPVTAVGDPCQPTGTLVRVVRQKSDENAGRRTITEDIPIEHVQVGDRVVSYDQSKSFLRRTGSVVSGITARPWRGDNMVRATLQGGRVTRYTPDHHCIVRIGEAFAGKHLLYLMRRRDDFRVGVTQGRYVSQDNQAGIVLRMHTEQADAVWVLAAFETRAEALTAETITAWTYGIPDATFVACGTLLTQAHVDTIWSKIGGNRDAAERLLNAYGRLIDFPVLTRGEDRMLTRRSRLIRACNLMDGMSLLPVEGATAADGKRVSAFRWERITVGRESYDGLVYSMTVENDHTYLGDGVVTHNCQAIYGWRGASVANLEDFPRHFPAVRPDGSSDDAGRYSLRENRRSGQLVLDLANGLAGPLRALHAGVEALTPCAENVGRGEIRTALLETYAEEISWIGGQVAAAIAEGTEPGEIAVLVRATRDIGPVHAELISRDIPVEVVGLGGLVHLPEVADVIAVLEVLDEATANAALVRLLAGPRWRIGPRDLALLGRRARDLVAVPRDDTRSSLEAAVPITDPAELVSLSDAMAWPGDLGYSDAARARFRALDAEIADLRRHVGEPLLDLLHRVIAVTGLDVEIAAGPHAVASRRRESLAAFLDVAASFSDLDGDSSVAAFLAYLRAAEEHERGLDSATPGTANSVKLMTAHKAKGLEWDVVVLPDLTRSVFPSNQGRAKWTSRGDSLPFALRGDRDALPSPVELSSKGIDAFEKAVKEQAQLEERRLGYVAFTRPRRRLVASAHWWGPTQKKPRGPSEYLLLARTFATERGLDPGGPWAEEPANGAENPQRGVVVEYPWPAPLDPDALARRRAAAKLVRAALRDPELRDPENRARVPAGLSPADAETVAGWDRDLELLLTELARTRSAVREVELPPSLSASQVLTLAADPDALARDLARPMPRRPAPAARRGTRFHGWVEALFGQQPLLDPEDLPGAADAFVDDADLAALQKAFLRSPYADRRPHRIEAPFALAIGGRVVRGRIDAVYELLDGYEVVDWKTSKSASADPLQLAIYRLAWAEIAGVEVEQVSAAFLYVRNGKVVRPELPTREQLEEILAGPGLFAVT